MAKNGKAQAAKAAQGVEKSKKAMPSLGGSGDFVYVISTMANAVSYNAYITIDDVPRLDAENSVMIRGGAGLPNQISGFGDLEQNEANGMPMWTPQGLATRMTRERYNILKEHWLFKKHLAKGYVTVTEQDVTQNHGAIKKIVEGMETNDPRAPLNETTFKRYALKMQGKQLKITTNKDSVSMEKIDRFG